MIFCLYASKYLEVHCIVEVEVQCILLSVLNTDIKQDESMNEFRKFSSEYSIRRPHLQAVVLPRMYGLPKTHKITTGDT